MLGCVDHLLSKWSFCHSRDIDFLFPWRPCTFPYRIFSSSFHLDIKSVLIFFNLFASHTKTIIRFFNFIPVSFTVFHFVFFLDIFPTNFAIEVCFFAIHVLCTSYERTHDHLPKVSYKIVWDS